MIHTARSNTQATLTWTDRQDRNGRQTVVEGERSMSRHAVHRRAYASRDRGRLVLYWLWEIIAESSVREIYQVVVERYSYTDTAVDSADAD
ncbi:hypothetical protein J6590_091804 [Homalodisca vitripennis]|nr:hypothetical protein J6590_091804 [Homalodisca vitripennis]